MNINKKMRRKHAKYEPIFWKLGLIFRKPNKFVINYFAIFSIFLSLTLTSCASPSTPNPTPSQSVDGNLDVTKQTAEDAIVSAMEVYSYFALFPLLLDRNQPSRDGSRFKVKDENLDTFDELRAYLHTYFSEDITQTLLSNGMYEDEGGYLYATGKGRQKDETIQDVWYQTLDMSDIQITYEVIVSYQEHTDVIENPKTLYFIREQINGRWIFTSFPFFW